ncbi:MAG: hypothetical protein IRZ03_17150 [Acidobacterium ailaaui]|nr:hypothetical protein [Pseudacidobacterium ailaaui]
MEIINKDYVIRNVVNEWLMGKEIYIPFIEEMDILSCIIDTAISEGVSLDRMPLKSIYIRVPTEKKARRLSYIFYLKYNRTGNINVSIGHFLTPTHKKFDIIFFNPPFYKYYQVNFPGLKTLLRQYDVIRPYTKESDIYEKDLSDFYVKYFHKKMLKNDGILVFKRGSNNQNALYFIVRKERKETFI